MIDYNDRPKLKKREYDFTRPQKFTWRTKGRETVATILLVMSWLAARSIQPNRYDLTSAVSGGKQVRLPIGMGNARSFVAATLILDMENGSYRLTTVTTRHLITLSKTHLAQSARRTSDTTVVLVADTSEAGRQLGDMSVLDKNDDRLVVDNNQGSFVYRHRVPSVIASFSAAKAFLTWIFS